jgi:hypothetical protein
LSLDCAAKVFKLFKKSFDSVNKSEDILNRIKVNLVSKDDDIYATRGRRDFRIVLGIAIGAVQFLDLQRLWIL